MSDNPFLLPPGGTKPAPPERAPESDAQGGAGTPAPVAEPSHYIAVPASVESATHRIARPTAEPTSASAPAAEDTRVAAPRRWSLVLPDGTRVGLESPVLLGRDPAGIPDQPDAGLLPVVDPGKTVSKTHARLEPGAEGVGVRDLHSTNGVAIDTAAGRQLVTAGGSAVAPSGATIMLGSFAVRVVAG